MFLANQIMTTFEAKQNSMNVFIIHEIIIRLDILYKF